MLNTTHTTLMHMTAHNPMRLQPFLKCGSSPDPSSNLTQNNWSICSSLICVKSSHIECLWLPPFWWGQMISLIVFAASSASTLDGAGTKAWGWWWVCARDSSSAIGHGDAISESIISGLLGGSSRCVISDMSSASGPMASMLHGSSAGASSSGTHSISQQASPNACSILSLFISESLPVSGGSQGMEVLGLGLWCECNDQLPQRWNWPRGRQT